MSGRARDVGVYALVNTVNGKIYVGSALNVQTRFKKHVGELRAGVHHNPHLQRAHDIYGISAFELVLLERCDVEVLYEREQHWMDTLDVVNRGYNIRPRASSALGVKRTEVTREKMRVATRARFAREPVSLETRAKQSANKKGKALSEEHKARLRAVRHRGPYSAEERERLYSTRRGVPKTAEHREKIRKSNKMTAAKKKLAEDGPDA